MSRVPLKDMQALLERATYEDSYDVYGSEFMVCRICERDSGAGLIALQRGPNWHAPSCPVPRLQRKYERRGQHRKEKA
jgi:hypothetical protein